MCYNSPYFYIPADSTGTHSVYTTFSTCEIMFHVSTMLPYTPKNNQQVIHTNLQEACGQIFADSKAFLIR